MCCGPVRLGYATLRSRMGERLDSGCSATTNLSRQTLSAVSRNPRKLRGFCVVAVDFGLRAQHPFWRKFRHILSLFLWPCGLPDCQVHRVVFGIPYMSKGYVWSRESGFMASMPAKRNLSVLCNRTLACAIATLRNAISQIATEITRQRCNRYFD